MRLVLLDIFRCLAISLVLIGHIAQVFHHPLGRFFGFKPLYYVTLGGLGVTLFIILSGMVLELNYGKKDVKYSTFIAKRILKIYPVYYMCLVMTILIVILKSYRSYGEITIILNKLTFADCHFPFF